MILFQFRYLWTDRAYPRDMLFLGWFDASIGQVVLHVLYEMDFELPLLEKGGHTSRLKPEDACNTTTQNVFSLFLEKFIFTFGPHALYLVYVSGLSQNLDTAAWCQTQEPPLLEKFSFLVLAMVLEIGNNYLKSSAYSEFALMVLRLVHRFVKFIFLIGQVYRYHVIIHHILHICCPPVIYWVCLILPIQ